MRLGILEIFIILVVLLAIVVSARMFRANTRTDKQKDDNSEDTVKRQLEKSKSGMWSNLRRTGLALILVSAVFLFTAIGMFKWAFQSYLWAFIIVVIGFVIILVSRNK